MDPNSDNDRPRKLKPDHSTLEIILELGRCAVGSVQIKEFLEQLADNSYVRSMQIGTPFDWLGELTWDNSFFFIKALVRLENARMTSGVGSVSAICPAYRVMEERDRVAAMEVATWVVRHSRNPWVPFVFRKIRTSFEKVLLKNLTWAECREALDEALQSEEARHLRSAEKRHREQDEVSRRGEMLGEIIRRVHEERAFLQKAKSGARLKMLEEIGGLSVRKRLEHIAWDDTRPLSFYPDGFSKVSVQEVAELDPVTRERLMDKLKERRSGAWRRLAKQIEDSECASKKRGDK